MTQRVVSFSPAAEQPASGTRYRVASFPGWPVADAPESDGGTAAHSQTAEEASARFKGEAAAQRAMHLLQRMAGKEEAAAAVQAALAAGVIDESMVYAASPTRVQEVDRANSRSSTPQMVECTRETERARAAQHEQPADRSHQPAREPPSVRAAGHGGPSAARERPHSPTAALQVQHVSHGKPAARTAGPTPRRPTLAAMARLQLWYGDADEPPAPPPRGLCQCFAS